MLARLDTKVRGRFCVKRCGPSRRGVRTASAVLKNFVRQPEKTFSTVSVKTGKARCEHMFSALPLRADIAQRGRHVGFVPLAAVSRCSELSYETGQWSIRGLRPKSKTAWGHPTYRP